MLSCLQFLMNTAHFRRMSCKMNACRMHSHGPGGHYPFRLLQSQELKVQCNFGQIETYWSNRFGTIIWKPIGFFVLVTVICSLLCLQAGGKTLEQTYQPIWCLEWSISVLHVITAKAESRKPPVVQMILPCEVNRVVKLIGVVIAF